MEQKILSLKDDKIISEVELYDYPAELIGGRNFFSITRDGAWGKYWMNAANTIKSAGDSAMFFIPIDKQGIYTINGDLLDTTLCRTGFIKGEAMSGELAYQANRNTILPRTFEVTEDATYIIIQVRQSIADDFKYTLKLEKGNKPTDWTPAPEDLGLSYPDFITEFKPSISDRYILTEELIEYPEELIGGRNYVVMDNFGRYYGGSIQNNNSIITEGYKIVKKEGADILIGCKCLIGSGKSILTGKSNFDISSLYVSFYREDGSRIVQLTNQPIIMDGESFVAYINAPEESVATSIGFQNNDRLKNRELEFVKLEKGTIPTDWTPAPEDLNLSYPDHIQSFGTSFGNNILINEFIEQ